jgi:hypothetical protein
MFLSFFKHKNTVASKDAFVRGTTLLATMLIVYLSNFPLTLGTRFFREHLLKYSDPFSPVSGSLNCFYSTKHILTTNIINCQIV